MLSVRIQTTGTVTEDVTVGAGSGEITVCSGTPLIFNASGGAATNGYRYLVNDTYVAAAQTSSRRSLQHYQMEIKFKLK